MNDGNRPDYPTHTVMGLDNSEGESDRYIVLAYKYNGEFYSHDDNSKLDEFVGDEILKVWDLNISSLMA